jgi:hypothetical protein
MAPCTESVARDIAVAFYANLLRGMPVASALFRARTPASAARNDTALFFGMEGYPDMSIGPASRAAP